MQPPWRWYAGVFNGREAKYLWLSVEPYALGGAARRCCMMAPPLETGPVGAVANNVYGKFGLASNVIMMFCGRVSLYALHHPVSNTEC